MYGMHDWIHGGKGKTGRESRIAEEGFRVPAIVVRVGGVVLAGLRILWSKCDVGAYGGWCKKHGGERKGRWHTLGGLRYTVGGFFFYGGDRGWLTTRWAMQQGRARSLLIIIPEKEEGIEVVF